VGRLAKQLRVPTPADRGRERGLVMLRILGAHEVEPFADTRVLGNPVVAQARGDPPLGDLHPDLDLRLVAGLSG
jgi:hypothetical protein